MKFYPEDYEVEVNVAFTDLNGAIVAPTEVLADLYDGEDELVVSFGSLPFESSEDHKTIIIPAPFNRLAEGELTAIRILRVQLVTPAGTVRRSFSYTVEGEFRLELLQNTFMSYEAAEVLARNQVNTAGWNVASEERRQAALIEAYGRLTQIPMKFSLDADEWLLRAQYGNDSLRRHQNETVILRNQWSEITREDFAEFPTHFKKALRAAQFAEANEMLQGDTVARKHRAGIITESIGESSVTLRAGKIDYGVSSTTLAHLTGYIYFSVRIARS